MSVSKATVLAMLGAASDARDRAYAPYSEFRVGAAVLAGSGKVYVGCNVENASYGLTVCAERVAILRAVSEGETSIAAVVVVGGDAEIARPCGACLQVMAEFSRDDEPVVIAASSSDLTYDMLTLDDYLPLRFMLEKK